MIAPSSTPLPGRLAAAPISWGVCEVPGWGLELDRERVLGEMAQLGLAATELGSVGYLPTDPAELLPLLERHHLDLLGGFVPLVLHDPSQHRRNASDLAAAATLFAATGASFIVSCPIMDFEWGPRRELSVGEWGHFFDGLALADEVAAHHGLTHVLHPHLGAVIQEAREVQRVLDESPVQWCLDTGHLTAGGVDVVDFATTHAERVGLVHLKDLRLDLAPRVARGELSILEGVQAGMFTVLGQGDVDIAGTVAALEGAGYRGWYVLEHDTAITGDIPPVGEGPIIDVAASISYIGSLGV